MFGKKQHNEDIPVGESAPQNEKPTLRIATIPNDFYGGKNPSIYAPPKVVAPPPPPEPVAPPPPEPEPETPIAPPRSKKGKIIGIALGFLLLVAGVTAYYLYDAGIISLPPSEEAPPVVVTPPPPPPPPPPPEPEPEPEEPEPEEPDPIEDLESLRDAPITFPAMNNSTANDMDFDSLTDAEEEVFGTDPGMWDTDGDGYHDGQEVVNLYNPIGFAPVRIIDSGIVRSYINPQWGYELYYPSAWQMSTVDPESREVLMSGITGDYIAVYTRTLAPGETFQEWFTRSATGQRITDLRTFHNRFDINGYLRSDGLVGYIGANNLVYVLVYYPMSGQDVRFRTLMEMVMQSFRPDASVIDIPEQPVLPGMDLPVLETPTDVEDSEDIVDNEVEGASPDSVGMSVPS